jgi:multidrug efflux pump subunit AcrA (membrane-fusion protein)
MTAPILRSALFCVPVVLLMACDRAAPPAEPLPTLERPLVVATLRNDRVLAPQAALVERGGQPGVFVVTDGIARFRLVRTGKAYEGRVEILSGLSGGEPLVAGEQRDIHDGSPITPVTTASNK